MATPLQLSTHRRDDGRLVLAAVGELDLSNIEVFSSALRDAAAGADGTPLRVDLTAVEYLDSGAINVFGDLHNEKVMEFVFSFSLLSTFLSLFF